MDVSAATWSTLSKLLDEALDLDPAARAAWFEQLSVIQPLLAPSVRKLLAAHASSETADILAQLPRLELDAAKRLTALVAGDLVGPYRLKRELGSGGMADVWLAERADGAFTRDVALKLPLVTRLRRDLAQRFARERDILARLEHPHIARLYDAGVSADGLPYLAMEYVDGQAITEYCDVRMLDVEARLRLFTQVLNAVQYAHASLVIHRDLKPSNILVTAGGEVRLLDFGIAKLLADDDTAHETQLTQLAGRALTPDYASPEQIKGESLTIATDIYSLGVVLYELLVGQRPYRLKVKSAAQLEQAILEAEPIAPSAAVAPKAAEARQTTDRRLKRTLSGDLDTIALKALAKVPSRRYLTVGELALDLTAQSDRRPISARRSSFRYRTRKFVARNRFAVSSACVLAVILVTASAISLRQAENAEVQAARADGVKRFVLDMFNAAHVEGGGNRQTTAVELLKQARERLMLESYTDAAMRSELMSTIGSSLRGLGEVELAMATLAEATDFATQKFGQDHPLTARANLEYAQALVIKERYAEAKPHIESAQRAYRRLEDAAALSTSLQLESRTERDVDRAILLAREAVHVAETRQPRVDKHALAGSYFYLATTLRGYQRKEALEPARRAYSLAKEIEGGRRTDLLVRTHALYAKALADEGEPAAAAAELKLILEEQIKFFGATHHNVVETLRGLAELSRDMGDPRAALEYTERGRRIEQTNNGDTVTAALAQTYVTAAGALADARMYPAAIAEMRVAESMTASLRGPQHVVSRLLRSAIARMLVKTGNLHEADLILTALLQHAFSSPLEQGVINSRLGLLRSAQGRHAEAEELTRPAVTIMADTRSPIIKAPYLVDLATVLLDGGKPAEALALLQEAKSIYTKWQPNGSPQLADLAVDIARANLALGRVDEALEASAFAVSFWKSFDPGSRSSDLALAWRTRAEAQAGRGEAPSRSDQTATVRTRQ